MPKTNVCVERDFGMLDRIMNIKPSASVVAIEAMIMATKNRTCQWARALPQHERDKYMSWAKESKESQRKQYADRVKKLWEERQDKIRERKKTDEDKLQTSNEQNQDVYREVHEVCGGVWMSV